MSSGFILGNKVIDVVFVSMAIAQIYKVVEPFFTKKKFILSRLWETGGMPSSHSSSVSALSTAVALTNGVSSIDFAICVVFSIVVMYDASGIRKAAGEHAGVLNEITDFFTDVFGQTFQNGRLKELLGHSFIEVFVGALLGIGVALIMKSYLLA